MKHTEPDSSAIGSQVIKQKNDEDSFRLLVESVKEYAILMLDTSGNITSWNKGAHRIKGYEREEILGRHFSTFYTPEDISIHKPETELKVAIKEGRCEDEGWRVRKDGSRFWANVVITSLYETSGELRGFAKVTRDFTDRKILEEQILEASRLKSEFLANMSHELRTPLNAIIGFSELMYNGKVGPQSPQHKEFTGDILNSSRHLLRLINDVLDLAKIESGKIDFQPEPIELEQLIQEIRDVARGLIGDKKIHLEFQIDPSVNRLNLDPDKLKQILYNYTSNAIKFTPENGTVSIRAKPEPGELIRIEVEDTGIGIPKEDVDKLFREFQQLDSGAAKKYAGTGLGLALTKRIVEAQGGTVGVESQVGKGSTFFAILPKSMN